MTAGTFSLFLPKKLAFCSESSEIRHFSISVLVLLCYYTSSQLSVVALNISLLLFASHNSPMKKGMMLVTKHVFQIKNRLTSPKLSQTVREGERNSY